jgi:hypothetical protein
MAWFVLGVVDCEYEHMLYDVRVLDHSRDPLYLLSATINQILTRELQILLTVDTITAKA